MLKLEYDKKEIEEVIDKIVKKTMNMDLTWDWPCGVAYYGISDAYEKTGKKEYLELLKDRIDELIDLGLPMDRKCLCYGTLSDYLIPGNGRAAVSRYSHEQDRLSEKRCPALWRSCTTAYGICQQ